MRLPILRGLGLTTATVIALAGPTFAQQNELQSAGALAFGPNDTLFVGDSKYDLRAI